MEGDGPRSLLKQSQVADGVKSTRGRPFEDKVAVTLTAGQSIKTHMQSFYYHQ